MNLLLNEDQIMLQDTIARLLKTESTSERIRAAEATNGFDTDLWSKIVELGFHSMRATEESGGMGMSLLDAAVVTEEHGRYIAPIPLCEAIAANRLLSLLAGDAAKTLCEQALNGDKLISFLPSALIDSDTLLPWAEIADGILALDGDNVVLLENLASSDESQKSLGSAGHRLCRIDKSSGISSITIAEGAAARDAFLATVEEWKLLCAAALAGLSRQCLAMASEYACEREQFGSLIGSYQGIAHPLATGLSHAEGMQLLVWRSIWEIANNVENAAASSSLTYWWATTHCASIAATCLHTFGGYGVSLEYDIQLYYRRAKAWSLLAGNPANAIKDAANTLWANRLQVLPDVGEVSIDFGLGENSVKMADEVSAFFDANLTDELRAKAHHSVAGYDQAFSKKLCAAGLRYPHWPKEYGGREATPYDMAALNATFEDYGWERITGPITNQIAFSVMEFANQQVKDEVIGKFASGEALGCLGFSEPSSGSDIYGAKMQAVRDGDDWIINGQKIFTTSGNLANYIFLLTRTNNEVSKHKGITIFIVPMDLPGIEIQPVYTIQDERTNITYMENVRVPDKYRLGEVDGGIKVMLYTMEMEHGGADQYRLNFESMLTQAVKWASNTKRNGQPIIEDEEARISLAKVAANHAVSKALCFRSLWASYNKVPNRSHFGPVSKLYTTESYLSDAMALTDLAAPWSLFEDRHGAGHIELGYRQSIGTTIYGGTAEIMRSIIAEHGLGLPKSRN